MLTMVGQVRIMSMGATEAVIHLTQRIGMLFGRHGIHRTVNGHCPVGPWQKNSTPCSILCARPNLLKSFSVPWLRAHSSDHRVLFSYSEVTSPPFDP